MVGAAALHSAVWALLDAITTIDTYDGEVPATPPGAPDGRAREHAILYAAPGRPQSVTLDAPQSSLAATFQVTCVGGDPARAAECVDTVRTALIGAAVDVGGKTAFIRASDIDPGTFRDQDGVWPPRWYAPLLFSIFIP